MNDFAPAPGSPGASGAGAAPSPSLRPPPGDVNVTVPPRMPRPSQEVHHLETLIGEHTAVEGSFRADGPVRILGSVKGEVHSAGSVFVDEKATVSAHITANEVTVAGSVEGQIHCDGRVEIRPTGKVSGEIHARILIVQEGAYFDGVSKMAAEPDGKPPLTKPAKTD